MKKSLKFLALTALMPVAVMAQGSLDEEVNAELDRMYGQQSAPAATAGVPAVTAPSAMPAQAGQIAVPITVVTPVTQQSALQAIQKQPTTVIEAAPLVETGAERLRKSRQEAELSTEQSIAEKLEQSRLEDERKRAEKLFGSKLSPEIVTAPAAPVVAAPVVTAPVVPPPSEVVVAPAPVPAVVTVDSSEKKEIDRAMIQGEISAALAELKEAEEEKPQNNSYFGVMAGAGDYPDAANVRGHYSLGVAYGKRFDDRMVLEGSFLYSNYEVQQRDGGVIFDSWGNIVQAYPRITEMNQYSTSGLLKYQLLRGMFRPELGGLLAYTYRTFADRQMALSSEVTSSHALDFGLMTGASLELSPSFSLGLDFRYMWNLTSKVDKGYQSSFMQTDKAIERFDYYTFTVLGKATF